MSKGIELGCLLQCHSQTLREGFSLANCSEKALTAEKREHFLCFCQLQAKPTSQPISQQKRVTTYSRLHKEAYFYFFSELKKWMTVIPLSDPLFLSTSPLHSFGWFLPFFLLSKQRWVISALLHTRNSPLCHSAGKGAKNQLGARL